MFQDDIPEPKEIENKKRKIDDNKKQNILEYSSIKLPAVIFLNYLNLSSREFLRDCYR
jgi:hypothetical protein